MNNEWLLEPKTKIRFNVTSVEEVEEGEEVILIPIGDEIYAVNDEVPNVVKNYCSVTSTKIEQKTIIAELKNNEEALIEIGKAYLENVKIDTEEIFYKYCTEKYLRIKDKVFVIDHISGFDPRD